MFAAPVVQHSLGVDGDRSRVQEAERVESQFSRNGEGFVFWIFEKNVKFWQNQKKEKNKEKKDKKERRRE